MVMAQRIIGAFVAVCLVLATATATAYAALYAAAHDRYVVADVGQVVTSVLLVGLVLVLLVGQLVLVPAVARRSNTRITSARELARPAHVSRETWATAARAYGETAGHSLAFFPAGHPRTPPPVPFSLSPIPPGPGR